MRVQMVGRSPRMARLPGRRDLLDDLDSFFAGFANVVTNGANNQLREALYGDIAGATKRADEEKGTRVIFPLRFPWTAARSERGLQAEALGRLLLPFRASKRTVSPHRAANRVQFGLRLRAIYAVRPIARLGDRPAGQ